MSKIDTNVKNTKEELFLAELGIDVNELIDCGYGAKLRLTSILNDYEKLVNKLNKPKQR